MTSYPQDKWDFYLKHFHFVAEQRLKILGFYFIASIAIITTTTDLYFETENQDLKRAIGGLHILLAIAFYFLDKRSLKLLETAKRTLIYLESTLDADLLKMFTPDRDEHSWPHTLNMLITVRAVVALIYFGQMIAGAVLIYGA